MTAGRASWLIPSSLAKMSQEQTALEKCTGQLERVLEHNIDDIARYLQSEGFINDELYKEVITEPSAYSDADKASKLVHQIIRRVILEPNNYYKLINHLRLKKGRFSDIVDMLDAEYFGTRQFPFLIGQASKLA